MRPFDGASSRHGSLGRLVAALLFAAPLAALAANTQAAEITRADFFEPGLAPVRANKSYDVTIVYFLDYQCPICRQHTDEYARVFADDGKLRVIYRDTPIFGPQSQVAAQLALASQFQGKHDAFHLALMHSKGRLTDEGIRAAARTAGVDWARLQKDLAAHRHEIDAQIELNERLSEAAGISGTPAFIAGDELVDGALDEAGLRQMIADHRKPGH